MFDPTQSLTSLRRLRNRSVTLPEAQRSNDILNVERYDLWVVPHYPIDSPWVRYREIPDSWQSNLLESIRTEGLKWPLTVYGHSPKGPIIDKYRVPENADRSEDTYVFIGTNRYWCLKELGWETFPAVLSLNKGTEPEWEAWKITPEEYPQYCPDDCFRIWVREHAFGYKPKVMGQDEFK